MAWLVKLKHSGYNTSDTYLGIFTIFFRISRFASSTSSLASSSRLVIFRDTLASGAHILAVALFLLGGGATLVNLSSHGFAGGGHATAHGSSVLRHEAGHSVD